MDQGNQFIGDAMNTEITIVNRGRGMQLSTSRITVQDLVPYFQSGSNYAEIRIAPAATKGTTTISTNPTPALSKSLISFACFISGFKCTRKPHRCKHARN